MVRSRKLFLVDQLVINVTQLVPFRKVNRLVVCDGGRKFFECCGVHIVLSGSDKVSIGMVVRYNPNIVGGLDTFGPDRFANIIF